MSRENEPDFGDAQDEIRWLRDGISAERKRREGLEDELHHERLAHTSAVTRAEQAERERDVLQRHYDAAAPEHNLIALLDLYHERQMTAERERDAAREGMSGQQRLYAEVEEKLERAEADNAALLMRLERLKAQRNELAGRLGAYTVPDDRETNHPGAALLERMRELESVREAVEPWRAAILKQSHPDDVDAEDRALIEACAVADALKETP